MISALVPFDELLEDLKDQTGITNTTPLLEKLRRFAFKAERELGYSGAVVLKKIEYTKDVTNFDGTRVWMPKDWLEFWAISDENGEVNQRSYIHQGDYLHFCDKTTREKVQLYYYGLMCDGFGNPCVTRNHQQSVIDYMKWRIKSPMAFLSNNRVDRLLEKDYEQDWKDTRDAAQGNDAWPTNEQDWSWLSTIGYMSTKDSIIYYLYENTENMCALEAQTECSLREAAKMIDVYVWQYDSLTTGIEDAPNIDQDFLTNQTDKYTLAEMIQGKTLSFTTVGRIGFALQGGSENEYQIWDILNQRIDSIAMNHYRDNALKLDIFITKEFYSHSSIFLKLKES